MKIQTTISILTASALLLASLSAVAQGRGGQGGAQAQDRAQIERGQKDFDRDHMRDRDRITAPERDRDRIQDKDRTHVPDNANLGENGIYGGGLMSVEERNQYREQLTLTDSDPEAQMKFKAQHQEEMQARAKKMGVEVDSQGPGPNYGDGIYGGDLMSDQERNQYREQLRLTDSDPQAQTELKAQHQEKMQARAKQLGVAIDPVPAVEEAE